MFLLWRGLTPGSWMFFLACHWTYLLISFVTMAAADTTRTAEISASMETVQLAAAQTNGNCERFRHGYMGYTLCVDYYTEVRDGGNTFVQIVGALTNEGSVHLCHLKFDIEDINHNIAKSPSWLPDYPEDSVFKAGSYFPFFLIIPWDSEKPNYPSVAIRKNELYPCDGGGNELEENEIRPNMNWKKETNNNGEERESGKGSGEQKEGEANKESKNEIKSSASSNRLSLFDQSYNNNNNNNYNNWNNGNRVQSVIIWMMTFFITTMILTDMMNSGI